MNRASAKNLENLALRDNKQPSAANQLSKDELAESDGEDYKNGSVEWSGVCGW